MHCHGQAGTGQLLLEARPSMVFVEHDAAFREKAATRVLRLEKPAL